MSQALEGVNVKTSSKQNGARFTFPGKDADIQAGIVKCQVHHRPPNTLFRRTVSSPVLIGAHAHVWGGAEQKPGERNTGAGTEWSSWRCWREKAGISNVGGNGPADVRPVFNPLAVGGEAGFFDTGAQRRQLDGARFRGTRRTSTFRT